MDTQVKLLGKVRPTTDIGKLEYVKIVDYGVYQDVVKVLQENNAKNIIFYNYFFSFVFNQAKVCFGFRYFYMYEFCNR